MANVQFYLPVDMTQMRILPSAVLGSSPSHLSIASGQEISVYLGSFAYVGNNVFGTVNAYEYYFGNALAARLTGVSLDAPTVQAIAYRGDAAALQAYALGGKDDIRGSYGNDVILSYAGDDVITGGGGNDILDGGTGRDAAFYFGKFSDYVVGRTPAGVLAVSDKVAGRDGTDYLYNIEALSFSDAVLWMDPTATQASVYRIYQAAFDRTPDKAGISYWIGKILGGMSLRDVAYGFVNSDEYRSIYGSAPTNGQLVEKLYANVLGRSGEASGVAYWTKALNDGASVLDVLASFAELPENFARTKASIEAGFLIDPSYF